jgi:hypothetical protein
LMKRAQAPVAAAGPKIGVIPVVLEEHTPRDVPHQQLMRGSGGVETRATRHGRNHTVTPSAKSRGGLYVPCVSRDCASRRQVCSP